MNKDQLALCVVFIHWRDQLPASHAVTWVLCASLHACGAYFCCIGACPNVFERNLVAVVSDPAVQFVLSSCLCKQTHICTDNQI